MKITVKAKDEAYKDKNIGHYERHITIIVGIGSNKNTKKN